MLSTISLHPIMVNVMISAVCRQERTQTQTQTALFAEWQNDTKLHWEIIANRQWGTQGNTTMDEGERDTGPREMLT